MPFSPPTATAKGDAADEESCQLLSPTALVVQAVLGVLVLLSLVYKRHREPHKRPWRIWLFDVSKQVVGQMFVHSANVLLSDIVSQYTAANACVFYFLHILMDTTLGVAALYLILHGLTHVFSTKLQYNGFESGVYGNPPSFNFWARQAALYVMSLTTMKLLVITLLILVPGIFYVGKWLLSWTHVGEGDSLQVIFVMGIFPIIMNVLQFWLIDSIVKASGGSSVALEGNSPNLYAIQDREPLFRVPEDEDEDPYRPGDIENGGARHPSPPPNHDIDIRDKHRSSAEEHKSYTASSSEQAIDHSYPPSLASDVLTNGGTPTKQAKNLLKRTNRRAAPTPLAIRNQNSPAINFQSPGISPGQDALSLVPIAPRVPKTPSLNASDNTWEETWEDSDDWANRVGQEDWTGRRIEQTKGTVHDAWASNLTIQVGS